MLKTPHQRETEKEIDGGGGGGGQTANGGHRPCRQEAPAAGHDPSHRNRARPIHLLSRAFYYPLSLIPRTN